MWCWHVFFMSSLKSYSGVTCPVYLNSPAFHEGMYLKRGNGCPYKGSPCSISAGKSWFLHTSEEPPHFRYALSMCGRDDNKGWAWTFQPLKMFRFRPLLTTCLLVITQGWLCWHTIWQTLWGWMFGFVLFSIDYILYKSMWSSPDPTLVYFPPPAAAMASALSAAKCTCISSRSVITWADSASWLS